MRSAFALSFLLFIPAIAGLSIPAERLKAREEHQFEKRLGTAGKVGVGAALLLTAAGATVMGVDAAFDLADRKKEHDKYEEWKEDHKRHHDDD